MAAPRRPERVIRITDPRAIRALAHEVRQRLVAMLARGREFTATEAAVEIGITPSAMSYHLRLLAKYGLAEPAEASSDGRERRWRGTFDSLVMSPEGARSRGSAAAHLEVFQAALRQSVLTSLGLPEVAERPEDRPGGQGITMARVELRLTPDRIAELSERLHDVLNEFDDDPSDEAGAVPVHAFYLITPQGVPGGVSAATPTPS